MESKTNEEIIQRKFMQFKEEIKDESSFKDKISQLYFTEFEEIFQDILLFPEEEIMSSMTSGVRMILTDTYTEDIFQNKKLNNLIEECLENIKREYENHYQILSKAWTHYESKVKNSLHSESFFLSNFRKHCPNTDDFAYHSCNRSKSKFLEVKEKNKLLYVICTDCQKCFFAEMIQCFCSHCNIDYYSSALGINEDPFILPATWENYHCKQIINERMKCIKCRELLYLNQKTKMLNCLNSKCKFIGNPKSIEWTCIICKSEFKSNAIFYNPLEKKVIKKIIQQTLLIKHKAHPSKVPCCKLNIFFTDFNHKKDCDGVLYVGELNRKVIIVCEKCKAINFYESFIWTCPKCGIRFKDKSSISAIQSSFEQKRFLISAREELHSSRKAIDIYGSPKKKPKVRNLFDILEQRKKNLANSDLFQHIKPKSEIHDQSIVAEEVIKIIKNTQSKLPDNKLIPPIKESDDLEIKRILTGREKIENSINEKKKARKEELKESKKEIGDNQSKRKNSEKEDEKNIDKKESNKKEVKKYEKKDSFEKVQKSSPVKSPIKKPSEQKTPPKLYNNELHEKEKEKKIIINKKKELDLEEKNPSRNEQGNDKIYMPTMPNCEGINSKEMRKIERKINQILKNGKIDLFNIDDYNIMRQLGEGSYGIIYQVQEKETKKRYALKKIIAHDLDEVVAFQREFELVNSVDHPNIMKIYGICIKNLDITTIAIYVLMEMANLDWDDEIRKHLDSRKNYKEEELLNILKQLVDALSFMQKNKISHRDIKPQNVLVFKHGVYKVADFGEAKEVKIAKQLNTLRGTELYMSPVLYDGLKQNKEDIRHNSFKSDVFSLGFCFIYAASLNFNIIYEVRDVKDMSKMEAILHKHLKNKYTKQFIALLTLMLEVDEVKRFDFLELDKYVKENFPDSEDDN